MHNKIRPFKKLLQQNIKQAQTWYQGFKLYDLGSYVLNRLSSRQGYLVQQHLPYGAQVRQHFDLFRSLKPRQQRPLLVFVHGGAWSHGDKKDYYFMGDAFAKEGYDVVVMNYHLAPTHIFPTFVDDIHVLLNYLSTAAENLQISTENIVLMGHSAGAFNVLSAVYPPEQKTVVGLETVRAVIGLAGPYHFDYKGDPLCQDAFDQSVPYQQVMPYYFVQSNHIKHYLFVAEKDRVVGHFNSHDLHQSLTAMGNHSEVISIKKLGHISMIGSLSTVFSRFFATKTQVLAALEDVFGAED